jgi:hypothetical protein
VQPMSDHLDRLDHLSKMHCNALCGGSGAAVRRIRPRMLDAAFNNAGIDGEQVPLHEQDIDKAGGAVRREHEGRVLLDEVRDRADVEDGRREYREHVVHLRAERLSRLVALRRHQARRHRHDEDGGSRLQLSSKTLQSPAKYANRNERQGHAKNSPYQADHCEGEYD